VNLGHRLVLVLLLTREKDFVGGLALGFGIVDGRAGEVRFGSLEL